MKQTVYINNRKVDALIILTGELAWRIDSVSLVFQHLLEQNKIVLGGDILTMQMKHNYDNWYYNIDPSKSRKINSQMSYDLAMKYIQNYQNWNGNDFYVVLVVK